MRKHEILMESADLISIWHLRQFVVFVLFSITLKSTVSQLMSFLKSIFYYSKYLKLIGDYLMFCTVYILKMLFRTLYNV